MLPFCCIDAMPLLGGAVQAGNGAISFDQVVCTGMELRLADCSIGSTVSCNHNSDVGVTCNTECEL